MTIHRRTFRFFAVGAFIALSGCAGRTAYQRGIEAEKRGEGHLAYAYYAKAAQSNPDNGTYIRAIKRLGPLAASHWMVEAKLARAEGRLDDAWKACMRCLAIQPDRSEALQFHDDLERDFGPRLAGVKREWQREGSEVLAIPVSPPSEPRRAERPDQPIDDTAARQPPPTVSRRTTRKQPQKSQVSPPPDGSRTAAVGSHGPLGPTSDTAGYFATHTIAEKVEDGSVKSVDGVTIRLQGTSDDMSADFDLLEGDRRLQKIRDLKVGGSKLLLSPSGRWFRLTLIQVDPKADSVKIGLNPE